jgi:hypothetical protein
MSGRFFHSKRSKINTLLPSRPSAQSAPARPSTPAKPYKKGKIPKALREALWLKHCGKSFEVKCHTTWCQNLITAYDFHAGHNIPECRGGATTLDNLVPICSRCNLSMGSQYTFTEWCRLNGQATPPTAAAAPAPTAPPPSSFWCCTAASCVEACIEPDTLEEQPTVQANPLPAIKPSKARRVSPGPGGPAVIVV